MGEDYRPEDDTARCKGRASVCCEEELQFWSAMARYVGGAIAFVGGRELHPTEAFKQRLR